ncbi:hypothetical protein ACDT12_13300, partial [Staphylococcus aureus]
QHATKTTNYTSLFHFNIPVMHASGKYSMTLTYKRVNNNDSNNNNNNNQITTDYYRPLSISVRYHELTTQTIDRLKI